MVLALTLLDRHDLSALASSQTLRGYEGELSARGVILTAARAFWHYVKLLLLPVGYCADHRVALCR